MEFASRMVEMIAESRIKTKRIWFSDEAHFWLSGYVNDLRHRIMSHATNLDDIDLYQTSPDI